MSKHKQWLTPPYLIESARLVLGEIDCDPATCLQAQKTINAATYYTKQDNGLVHPWSGRVWINPPYNAPWMGRFVDKLLDHLQKSDVTAAILMCNNATDTSWWQKAIGLASGICFAKGRIASRDEYDVLGPSPPKGHNFFYFGPAAITFLQEFKKYGATLTLGR